MNFFPALLQGCDKSWHKKTNIRVKNKIGGIHTDTSY